MPAWLADENFNAALLRGLLRRSVHLNIVRLQDVGLAGADDPAVLDYAASVSRVLLTHDGATMPQFAYGRVAAGLKMPGVIVVRWTLALHQAIEEIRLMAEVGTDSDYADRVHFLPL